MDPRPIFFSVIVALIFVTANVLTEKSLAPGKSWYFMLACVLACLAFLGFRWCCQKLGLAIASAVVDSLLTLLTVAYAILVLHERLTMIQYTGIVLLLVGTLLVKGPWSGEGQGFPEKPASEQARIEP